VVSSFFSGVTGSFLSQGFPRLRFSLSPPSSFDVIASSFSVPRRRCVTDAFLQSFLTFLDAPFHRDLPSSIFVFVLSCSILKPRPPPPFPDLEFIQSPAPLVVRKGAIHHHSRAPLFRPGAGLLVCSPMALCFLAFELPLSGWPFSSPTRCLLSRTSAADVTAVRFRLPESWGMLHPSA